MLIATMLRIIICIVTFSYVYSQYNDAECPRGWTDNRNECYKFTRTPTKDRKGAFQQCRDYNAELVSVNNEEEHKFIVNWLLKSDPQHEDWYTSGNLKNGVWFWDGDGEQFLNIKDLWLNDLTSQDQIGEDAVYAYSEELNRWGLKRIRSSQKLRYICEVSKEKAKSNRLLVEERTADFGIDIVDELFIPRAPKFIIQPVDAIFDSSARDRMNHVQLRCVADGYPFPEYKWFREEFEDSQIKNVIMEPLNDRRLTQTDGTLDIYNPKQDDLGKYHCLAQNKFGTVVSQSVDLNFGYIGEFSSPTSPESSKIYGKAYWGRSLFCDPPNHYPTIQYNWVRDEFRNFVQEDRRLFVSMDGNLYFSSLEKSDEASYSCNVRSVISSTGRTGPFYPLIVQPSSSRQALQFPNNFPKAFPEGPLAGDNVRLECVAFGFPVPSYSWSRRGSDGRLPEKSNTQNYDRILYIPDISIEDFGEYTCTASNEEQSIQSSVFLSIRAKPVFTIPLEDKFVDADSTVTWLCEAFGDPKVRYGWLKNGRELNTFDLPVEDQSRYKIDQNILTIQYVDADRDQGVYQCKAANSVGTTYSSGWLKVLSFKPSFKKYPLPEEMFAVIGGNITLPCRPEGAPKPTYSWRRNGLVVGNGGNARILNNGFLQISPVRRDDEGTYICRAQNDLGEDRSSGRLIILEQPKMRVQPQTELTPIVNDSVQLQCAASSYEEDLEISYIWHKNDIPIRFELHPFLEMGDRDGYLRIRRVGFEHDGTYTCMIRTPLMTISKSTTVRVLGPPGPPGGLSAANPTSDSIELRWTNGATNGAPITTYYIQGMTNHQREWVDIVTDISLVSRTMRGLNQYKIEGLLSPYSDYNFRVGAKNEYGIGQPSFPSPIYSIPGAPPTKYPSNVGGGGGKIGDLTIRWTPLSEDDWNSNDVWYNVYWKERDSAEEFLKKDHKGAGNTGHFAHSVGSENFYRPYKVKVQAVNEFGSGPISPEVIVMSAEDLPAVNPDRVILTAYNSTAMNVSWTPVKESREKIRGTLLGHRIKYWEGNDDNLVKSPEKAETKFIRGKQPWGLVVGLRPNSWYTMTVSVYNSAGSGGMSTSSSYYTFKKAPVNAPTSIKMKAVSRTSIVVRWRYVTPSQDEEPIIGYKVRYWEKEQGLENAVDVIKRRGQGDLEAQVTGLVPGRIYYLRVLAYSRGGDGKMSSPAMEFRMGVKSSRSRHRSSSTSLRYQITTVLIAFFILAAV